MTCDTILLDSLGTMRQVCTDTIINNLNYDSLTVAAIEKTHILYNSQFSTFTMVVSILVILLTAICAALITINFRSTKGAKGKFKKMNKDFEDYRKIQQEKFSFLSRLVSERYQKLALENLENNDFFGYFSNMYIFCFCITGINLNQYDSNNLLIAFREFENKCKNNNGTKNAAIITRKLNSDMELVNVISEKEFWGFWTPEDNENAMELEEVVVSSQEISNENSSLEKKQNKSTLIDDVRNKISDFKWKLNQLLYPKNLIYGH